MGASLSEKAIGARWSRLRIGLALGALVLLASLGGWLGKSPAGAAAVPTCTLAGGDLTIQPPDLAFIDLKLIGQSVAAQDLDTDEHVALSCAGGSPTVLNTDRIVIDQPAFHVVIDMGGGRFAPGRTDEGDGSSEIEFDLRSSKTAELFVFGTEEPDQFQFGDLSGQPGANLNAGEATGDVDVLFRATTVPLVAGGGAADVITARGGPGFSGPFNWGVGFNGHGGADLLLGAGGPDSLNGNTGRNRMSAGGGRDDVFGDLGGRDKIKCGAGRDRAIVEKRDRVNNCERVKRIRGLPVETIS